TDAEKLEAARDPRVRAMLERTARLDPADLARFHGAWRVAPGEIRPGDRVRLRPRRRADSLDTLLAGRTATVVSAETDLDGRRYLSVTIDDDPGRDLGAEGKPGHRFFFFTDEVEPA